jgi:hypothetical protein
MRSGIGRLLWLLAAAVSLAGCGGETVKLPDTVPFSGKVTLDGKPLSGAAVQFAPARMTKDGHAASGRTNDEGKYELTTMIGNHSKPGVVPGSYQVVVSLLTSADALRSCGQDCSASEAIFEAGVF